LSQALRVVKPGGRIILIGFGAPEGKINLPQIVRQEIEIRGSIIYVADFPKAIKFIHDGIVPASKIVTHKFPLNDIRKGFDVALRGEGLKVLVTV
jgi:threonine dehydrogenase-like Zn-dependent dehydrogenase